MSSAYLGSVRYFALLASLSASDDCVQVNDDERAVTQRWSLNHCNICGANGPLTLTIPILKENFNLRTPMRDVKISNHGNWRHLHWGAIFSAYGKSPFFEYAAPELEAIYHGNQKFLLDFNNELQAFLADFFALPVNFSEPSTEHTPTSNFCNLVGEKKPDQIDWINNVAYYQHWAARYGFLPNLSILDLVMNTGREAALILPKMIVPHA